MPIQVLAPYVVSKIAAGEVIERPASVVKELIENALDAHATSIAVEIQNGGVARIMVTDDGTGISPADVELAFTRHATSKITSLDDLENIATLGFRGEALASIAAVADIELLTHTESEFAGSHLVVKSEKIIVNEKHSRSRGTTVTVNRLFRTVPARLKFLKSPATESSHVSTLLMQYALAFPSVRFSFTIDDRQTLGTPGNGSLCDAIAEVYNAEIARHLQEVQFAEGDISISGLVSPAHLSRTNRNYMSVFVNHRWIRSLMLTRAIEDAYQGLLMVGRHPIAVINIILPAGDVDVNVHPTKSDVRFRDSGSVFAAVQKAIRKVIGDAPLPSVSHTTLPSPRVFSEPVQMDTQPLFSRPPEDFREADSGSLTTLPILRVVGQLSNSYILAEGPDGLYLIDQHAAHERVLFEKILKQRTERAVDVQGLLDPITIEMNPRQDNVMKRNGDLLSQFGFMVDTFGDRTYLVRAVPSLLGSTHLSETIGTLLDAIADEKSMVHQDERIAVSLACHSAVRAGQPLSIEEMRALIRSLEESSQPRTCPHGRPTMIHLSSHRLQREFGRTG
ncbi:MAG TPA: DNA mismatch repair endonuclease MutL [Dehalococcoidia bacterium]|nr:DNA mismatch repair endonuclease MutL [Dehalococcoidia bacterium]